MLQISRIAAFLVVFLCAIPALAQSNVSEDGRYIVTMSDTSAAKSAVQAAGGTVALDLPSISGAAVYLPEESLQGIVNNPHIVSLEVDPRRQTQSEPSSDSQHTPYGIEMVQALNVDPGVDADEVRVCIVDSGYDLGHESLPTEGVTGDANDGDDWSDDCGGHGTHVTGTIAALDNGVGVEGVYSQSVDLHIVKVFSGSNCGWVYGSDLIRAVDECQEAGSNVINMSLGGAAPSTEELQAFTDAKADGTLTIAAAGNGGSTDEVYPASYESVVSVAAIDEDENRASWSEQNDQVELSAPGVDVWSTVPEGTLVGCNPAGNRCSGTVNYAAWSGTSMAAPHVSGVAALLWSHNRLWTASQIREALRESAKDLSDGWSPQYGYGLVQAEAALTYLQTYYPAEPLECPESCADGEYCDGEATNFECVPVPPECPESCDEGEYCDGEETDFECVSEPEPVYDVEIGPSHDSATGAPGDAVTYEFGVCNTGNTDDSYELSADGGDWTAVLDFPEEVAISAGECATVAVIHQIPTDASHDSSATGNLSAVSLSSQESSAAATFTTTADDPPEQTDPDVDAFELEVDAFRHRGRQQADLYWNQGATDSGSVDILRDGSVIESGAADSGYYGYSSNITGGGAATFQVCESATDHCSEIVDVEF